MRKVRNRLLTVCSLLLRQTAGTDWWAVFLNLRGGLMKHSKSLPLTHQLSGVRERAVTSNTLIADELYTGLRYIQV